MDQYVRFKKKGGGGTGFFNVFWFGSSYTVCLACFPPGRWIPSVVAVSYLPYDLSSAQKTFVHSLFFVPNWGGGLESDLVRFAVYLMLFSFVNLWSILVRLVLSPGTTNDGLSSVVFLLDPRLGYDHWAPSRKDHQRPSAPHAAPPLLFRQLRPGETTTLSLSESNETSNEGFRS